MPSHTYTYLCGFQLPHHSVKITCENGRKQVSFIAPFYHNKESKITWEFSDVFTDHQILNDRDVLKEFIQRYGSDSLGRGLNNE